MVKSDCLEVDNSSRKFLTINTICGLYVYNRLCFGLSSASAIFQSVIDKILEGIKYCSAYQDDILIGGKDYNSCKSVLYATLNWLNDYNVKINTQKSEFFVKSLEMLGYVLIADDLSTCKSKTEKLINTNGLQNVTQLKSYLGLLNYYHKFIKMAPDVMEPLHNDECEKVFLMMLFDPITTIILTCDSNSYGVGTVLGQLHNGIEKQVAFDSAMLNNAQKNYSQLHRETLSIIYRSLTMSCYLFSEKKKIPQVANARLLRWSIILSFYQYKIQYKKGKNIQNADCLSHLPNNCFVALPDDYDCNFIYMSTPLVSYNEVADITSKDLIVTKVLETVMNGNLKKSVRMSIIHADHVGITRCKLMARSYVWWFGMNDDIEIKVRTCKVCQQVQNRGYKVITSWPVSKCPWYRIHIDLLDTHT
ncbi:hypothetical protein PR048_012067 [Dryococelus australis]|uniref:RNA-directed DNA polymerase n=1 Tax=Dryococelus australis TaxID=614101 RepID=A0ABQ9HP36_9NEOP|nr:hypothetical protein PR048_012067 [Dryococelus australis]